FVCPAVKGGFGATPVAPLRDSLRIPGCFRKGLAPPLASGPAVQQELAGVGAALHDPVGLRRLHQGQGAVDHRAHLPGGDQRPEPFANRPAMAALTASGWLRRVEPVSTSCFSIMGIRSTSTLEPLRKAREMIRPRRAATRMFLAT